MCHTLHILYRYTCNNDNNNNIYIYNCRYGYRYSGRDIKFMNTYSYI